MRPRCWRVTSNGHWLASEASLYGGSKAFQKVEDQRVDRVRPFALNPMSCAIKDVAAAQAGQRALELVDTGPGGWKFQHVVAFAPDEK